MSMNTNGRTAVYEDEWESPESSFEGAFEGGAYEGIFEDESSGAHEWGGHEAAFEDEFETSFENNYEDEADPFLGGLISGLLGENAHEAAYEGQFEDEWSPEGQFEDESLHESWESPETSYEQWGAPEAAYEGSYEDEADPFLPLLAPLAMKALPMLAKMAMPAVKKLLPMARRMVPNVVRSVLGGAGPQRGRPRPGPQGWAPAGGGRSLGSAATNATIRSLMRQLGSLLGEGESAAMEAEAQFFGSNEMQTEVAGHAFAQEAALTEVLAAEASHSSNEAESEALLGAALPITIRIMSARRDLRPVMPTLVRSNARLVSGIRRSGPNGQQLLRLVPAIQRRTVATLQQARRAGRPIPPSLVPRVVACQAARVLGTPRIAGPALMRNTVLRQSTVAPAGRVIRPRMRY